MSENVGRYRGPRCSSFLRTALRGEDLRQPRRCGVVDVARYRSVLDPLDGLINDGYL